MKNPDKASSSLSKLLHYLKSLKTTSTPRGMRLIDGLRGRIHGIIKSQGATLDDTVVFDNSVKQILEAGGLQSPNRRMAIKYAIALTLGTELRPKDPTHAPTTSEIQRLLAIIRKD